MRRRTEVHLLRELDTKSWANVFEHVALRGLGITREDVEHVIATATPDHRLREACSGTVNCGGNGFLGLFTLKNKRHGFLFVRASCDCNTRYAGDVLVDRDLGKLTSRICSRDLARLVPNLPLRDDVGTGTRA